MNNVTILPTGAKFLRLEQSTPEMRHGYRILDHDNPHRFGSRPLSALSSNINHRLDTLIPTTPEILTR
ncbi:uncharacterized protein LDX57_005920 [Aspergillus melleus]|uniref:uncharacterized protein n=1 Tax=Aspergillus melleus TaxID=138277 RepID=UPI001E8CD4EF|nr:uncharacterized protein LDX57_005920 [Aspergillus melleus]KAH8428217.1 hypothetical protein LDX57_005920 [Aspergillus melleus]